VRSFVLAATGRDRPGIVAAVTRVLLDHGVNIEDAEMAILRGHFAIVLVLSAPDELGERQLRDELETVGRELPLEALTLSAVEQLVGESPEPTHAISVYGADHPGIVHGVAEALARHEVNVVDLSTRVVGDDEPIYVMLLDVTLPASLDETALDELLARVGRELGVDVSARALDGDVL
jgi:glycine cleavage system transcriptional repressor